MSNHIAGGLRVAASALVALLMACVFAAPAWADPPARVGRVADVEGAVWTYGPEGGDWIEAVRNRPVTTGDQIATDEGAHAELRIGSSTVRLDQNSQLEVLQLDDTEVRLQLLSGSASVRVRSRETTDQVSVTTGEGQFQTEQPGAYRIDRLNDASTATAWSGSLRFAGAGQALSIVPGQRTDIWLDGTLRYNTAAPERDAFAEWVGTRDQAEDAAAASVPPAASRYVSPEMTGAEDLERYGSWQQTPDYGAVWAPTTVASPDWAPYRYGHWAYVQPWGWTWVDDAPWGFAPFHYGRWVTYGGRWCWSPGRYVARPVYAPALVAWFGGRSGGGSVSVGVGPSVGWFPLGPREVYVPSYRVSPRYVRNVNVTQVTNITNITNIVNNPNGAAGQQHYINRGVGNAVTVVPSSVLTRREPVGPVAKRYEAQNGRPQDARPDGRPNGAPNRGPNDRGDDRRGDRNGAQQPVMSAAPVNAPTAPRLAQGGAAPRPPIAAVQRPQGPRERQPNGVEPQTAGQPQPQLQPRPGGAQTAPQAAQATTQGQAATQGQAPQGQATPPNRGLTKVPLGANGAPAAVSPDNRPPATLVDPRTGRPPESHGERGNTGRPLPQAPVQAGQPTAQPAQSQSPVPTPPVRIQTPVQPQAQQQPPQVQPQSQPPARPQLQTQPQIQPQVQPQMQPQAQPQIQPQNQQRPQSNEGPATIRERQPDQRFERPRESMPMRPVPVQPQVVQQPPPVRAQPQVQPMQPQQPMQPSIQPRAPVAPMQPTAPAPMRPVQPMQPTQPMPPAAQPRAPVQAQPAPPAARPAEPRQENRPQQGVQRER